MSVAIQAIKKCGFLRQITEGAKASVLTVREALLATQKSHTTDTFKRGRIVVSQSGSGQSGSFEIGVQGKEWTADNLFGLIEELMQMLEALDPETFPDDADPAHTDAIRAQLAADINAGNYPQSGIREQLGDFSALNYPASTPGIPG